jgi:hypothetical protein
MTEQLLAQLVKREIDFSGVITFIETIYSHTPTAFINGDQENAATENQGSAKVLAFAKINQLSEPDTLLLFAEHYEAVLADPNGSNHQNIRQFMANGWEGVSFVGEVLKLK